MGLTDMYAVAVTLSNMALTRSTAGKQNKPQPDKQTDSKQWWVRLGGCDPSWVRTSDMRDGACPHSDRIGTTACDLLVSEWLKIVQPC